MTDFEKTYQNYNPRAAALAEARALLTEAAKAAPLILFSLAFGLALSLYGMYEDNKRYTRSSPYGCVKNSQSRSDDSRKVG